SITEKPIRNNVWQHIVLVKNGGSGWVLYVDNQEVGTWSSTDNIITNQDTVIGGNQNLTDRSIDGQLDNIRIFNKAVSPSEVTTLYNEGI
ncbi:MAG: LamG-like jellyroll fold domain-containing protein, partial [Flavobacteriaceae bacterium]